MCNIKKLLLLSALLFLAFIPAKSQTWLWAKSATEVDSDNANYYPTAVAADYSGNAIMAGTFYGSDLVFGSDTLKYESYPSIYIVKYSSLGNVLWARTPSKGMGTIYSISSDNIGNFYVTGYFSDSLTFGSFILLGQGGFGIIKFDPSGKVIWGKEVKGGSNGTSIAVDKTGKIYVTGVFSDTTIFDKDTLITLNPSVFWAKYDSSGNVIWAKQADCHTSFLYYSQQVISLATDQNCNVFLSGCFTDTITFGSYTLTNGGIDGNFFLLKCDSSGNVDWVTCAKAHSNSAYFIPQFSSSFQHIACDPYGDVYFAGMYLDTIIIGSYTFIALHGNNFQAFIAKYSSAGNLIWAQATSSAVTLGAECRSICTDAYGDFYVSGAFSPFMKFDSLSLTSGYLPFNSIFLIKFDSGGSIICGNSIANADRDLQSIAVDKHEHVFLTSCSAYYGHCDFGNDTVRGGMRNLQNFGFLSKWMCGTCNLSPHIAGPPDICKGQLATFTSPPGLNYLWSNGDTTQTITVNPKITTVYTMQVSDSNCSVDTVFTLRVDSIKAGISGTPGICKGKSVSLKATGGGTYLWSNGKTSQSITVTPDSTTKYTVVISKGACVVDTNYTVKVDSVNLIITGVNGLCKGQNTTMNASGAATYAWSTGSTMQSITVSPTITTTYTLQAKAGVCTLDTTLTIKVDSIIPSITGTFKLCDGQSTTLTAGGGTNYVWNTGNSTQSINVNPATPSTYTVTITKGACVSIDSVQVIVSPAPIISACCDSTISRGQSVQLTSSGIGTYLWTPSTGLSCTDCSNPNAAPANSTTYTLTITNDSGCSVSSTITIDVTCGDIFVPTAFSPNHDGQNDYLLVRGACIKSIDFIIFDRWGNKVFESFDKSNGWDGTYNNLPMNSETFVYVLNAAMYDGSTVEKKGNITLVR